MLWVSLVAQMVKSLPAIQETCVWSLGWEDPLEKEMATHSSILAWKIPWMELPGRLQSVGVVKRWTRLSNFHMHMNSQTHLALRLPRALRMFESSPPYDVWMFSATSTQMFSILHACQDRELCTWQPTPFTVFIIKNISSNLKQNLLLQNWHLFWTPPISTLGVGNGNPLQYSSLEIPWTEEPEGLKSMGLQRIGHGWACMHARNLSTASGRMTLSKSVFCCFLFLSCKMGIRIVMSWGVEIKWECNKASGTIQGLWKQWPLLGIGNPPLHGCSHTGSNSYFFLSSRPNIPISFHFSLKNMAFCLLFFQSFLPE